MGRLLMIVMCYKREGGEHAGERLSILSVASYFDYLIPASSLSFLMKYLQHDFLE